MYCFSTFCYTCFSTEHLQATDTLDFDNISFLDKIIFIMPNEKVDLDVPKYICLTCCSALRISYRFQTMLIKNHKQMNGYVTQLQKNNDRKQSVLKIKLVDYKKQAIRNKRKLQLYNKQEHKDKLKETVTSTNQSKPIVNNTNKIKTKENHSNSDAVIYQSTIKINDQNNDTYEIFIKEEQSPDNNKTLLGFASDELTCNLCDPKPVTPEPETIEIINLDDDDDDDDEEELPKNRVNNNKLVCEICGKVSTKLNEFNYHMLFHDSSNLFKCQFCDKSFTNEESLRRHCGILHAKRRK